MDGATARISVLMLDVAKCSVPSNSLQIMSSGLEKEMIIHNGFCHVQILVSTVHLCIRSFNSEASLQAKTQIDDKL